MKIRLTLAALLTGIVVFWLLKQPTTERSSPATVSAAPKPAAVAAASNLPALLPAMATFREWSELFLKANPTDRPALLAEGQTFAKEHTKEIAKLIKTDPQSAIAHAVPMVVRQKLPKEIVALLEERPRLRGDYLVQAKVPQPGQGNLTEPYARTVMAKDGTSWNAYVFGKRQWQRTTTNASLNGVSVGSDMAVSESPLRVLEAGEVPEVDGREVVELCPISGIKTEVEKAPSGELPPVSEETPAYETPEQITYVCRGGHISELDAQYLSEEEKAHWESLGVKLNAGTGSGPAHGAVGTIPSSWTTGNRSFLYIRCAFPDSPADPQNEQECYDMLKNANDFIVQNSYGRCYLTYAVPPLVILPYPTAWYTARGDGVLQDHARQIARGMGYDYQNFNLDAVRWTGGPGSYGGAAYVGFQGMWMKTSSVGTFLHELGHNLGLWHANFWLTSPPSITGPGENLEYGNTFDLMGSSGSLGHYTASTKAVISWMPQEQFWNVTRSGLYRVSQTDSGIADPSLRYALRIRQDSERDYWTEFRQLFASNTGLMNGVMMTWDRWGLSGIGGSGGNPTNGSNGGAHLLDMTPGSFGNGITDTRNDSALWVGRTYSDPDFNIHITPIAKNAGTIPPSVDVRVQIGSVPGNTAPSLSINASNTSPALGGSITLTATASDTEGDPLAYAWVFGDGTYSINNNAVQTKSWPNSGHYQVLCTASDMKGGRTTRALLITVGTPTTFMVSGTITGPGGQPQEGVYVANYSPSNGTSHANSGSFRGTWTDSSGNYVITNLSAGTYTIRPTLYPLNFSPTGTSTTVGPSVTGRNFSSSNLPAITITYPDAQADEGATPGPAVVRLTRAGSTSAALNVQMFNATSGTAVRNTDYTLNPTPTASGGTSAFTIPAGSATLDITITPINDSAVEGVEYAALDFANTAAGYVMTGNARAVVPIRDDESSLPLVRLTSLDDSGHETGPDTITLMLDRDAPLGSPLTVNLTHTGTATSVTDYVAPTSVTIPANSASATFTITPVNDAFIESTETIITTLATNAAYLRTSTAQSVTSVLNDDDMPVVSVVATDAAAAEAGANKGVFTISRTGITDASLTVDYAINGRAVLGTDYRRLDGRAVIPAGSTSITVEIVPFDDSRDEGTQDVILQLRTAQNYSIDNATFTATINIADDDGSEIYVELNSGSGVEPASGSQNGPVFQIHRPATGTAITVNYTISGTATSGVDFNALSGSVSFGAGTTNQTVTVSMLADTLQENAETVTLTLQPGTGYTLMPGQQSSMTGYIVDADQETVDVNVTDSGSLTTQISESSTSGTFYFFKRNSAGALTVNYTVSGTATSGSDFTPLSGTITIPDGQTSATLNVTALNDTIAEGVESIIITVTPTAGSYGTRFGSATMYIADNDAFGSGTVAFGAATASAAENVGTYNIPVNITGTPPGVVSVFYRVNGGTAAGNGIDFTLPPGVLNFAVGEATKNIPVVIRQDLLPEPSETLVVQLFNATGANLGTSSQTLTINNVSMPEAFSDPASGVSSSAMTFNGRVMPGGAATTWWFEYGGTTAYGLTTPVLNLAAGNNSVTVSRPVTGLTLTSYHFRLVAQNSLGITYGIDQFPGIISEPPVIVDHPQSLAVNEGASASFTVGASGGGLSYQWQKDTIDIPLATTPTYSIPVTTMGSAGSYRCVVTNADGTATSNPATLTIVTPPMITQHPAPLSLNADDDAVFTVTATGFFLTYQWQKDQVDMPGQTGQSLNLTSVTTLNDGSYRCIVTNSAGSANSNPATLNVNGPPNITQQPQDVAVNLSGTASFSLVAAGPGLTYQWQKDSGVGMANIDGATSATFSIPSTVANDAASYRCRVGNTLGIISSDTVTLTVVSPPVLVAPLLPSSLNLNEAQTFSTAVQVQGLFLSYEWRRDGVILPQATSPVLSIPNLTDAQNGSYTCRVWNAAGEVISPAVTLLVITPPVITNEPADTLVDMGDPATISVSATGPQLTYQWWRNGLPVNGAASESYTIPAMSFSTLGNYYCKVSNSAGTVTSRFALVGIEGMPVVTRAPYPVLAEAGSPMRLEVEADGENLTYAWKQNTKPAGSGAILEFWPYATKNAGLYVAEVKNALSTTTTLPVNVTSVTDMSPALDMSTLKWSTTGPAFWRPVPGVQAKDAQDALSAGNMPHGYFATLSTRVTGPLVLRWWQKVSTEQDSDVLSVLLDGSEVSSTSGILEWQAASLTVPAGVHQIDFVYAKDSAGSAGLDRVWLDLVSTAPATEPTGVAENRLVGSGTTIPLDAAFSGPSPNSFQWRRNGRNIASAIGAHWDIINIQTTQAGTYDCVLTSMVNGVKMTRITPPVEIGVVEVLNARHVVSAGTVLPLIAKAVGKNLTYQWRRSSTTLQGEIFSKVSVTLHQTTFSDDYICAVSNSAGTVDAGIRRVDVFNRAPEITLAGDLDDAVLSGPYRFQVPVNTIPAYAPTGFKAVGLPRGLVIDKVTGLITGIPEESSGTVYPVTITASNSVNSDTVQTNIFVHGLSTKTGIFTGTIVRNANLNQGLGGRIDLVITANGSFSGTLCLGVLKHSFKSRIVTSTTNLTQATSRFDVARGRDTPVRVDLLLTNAGLMSGTLTLGANSLAFDGWKVPWTRSTPATAFVGTKAPVGSYNFVLPMPPEPALADTSSPEGTGFGTFIVARDTGIATITGRLPDDSTYTASSAVGIQGQMVVFTPIYAAPNLGSLLGRLDIAPATNADDNTLNGLLSWSRPSFAAAAKQRLDPDGFEAPVALAADGARYIAPIAPALVLGLAEAGPNTASLSFFRGGIGSPPPTPGLAITLGKSSAVVPPAINPRKTTLSFVPSRGTFTGTFTLEDNDPLDLRPPPAVLRKLSRRVTFNGLLVLTADGWRGVGSFLLPELPDATGESLTTTPIHAGAVNIIPATVP